jgi:ribose 5-phosphate isomerase B
VIAMKIAVGSDEYTHLTDFVIQELKKRGIELELHGPLAGESIQWAEVAQKVAERVADGACDQGILFCWTGTGVSMAANKVPGIRAALCADAETARGAKKWNDANILAMSLRLTSPIVAKEILEAWFDTSLEKEEVPNIERVKAIEEKYSR